MNFLKTFSIEKPFSKTFSINKRFSKTFSIEKRFSKTFSIEKLFLRIYSETFLNSAVEALHWSGALSCNRSVVGIGEDGKGHLVWEMIIVVFVFVVVCCIFFLILGIHVWLTFILLVCELDLVFSLHKSLLILFEMFIGGMLCESSKQQVLKSIMEAEELVEEMTKPGEDTASQLDDRLSFQEQFQLGRKPGRRTGGGQGSATGR